MKNTVYLVSHNWRGALNIGDMRVFENVLEAFDYSTQWPLFRRVYEFAPGQPPKLLLD